jgi:hypothetical protein
MIPSKTLATIVWKLLRCQCSLGSSISACLVSTKHNLIKCSLSIVRQFLLFTAVATSLVSGRMIRLKRRLRMGDSCLKMLRCQISLGPSKRALSYFRKAQTRTEHWIDITPLQTTRTFNSSLKNWARKGRNFTRTKTRKTQILIDIGRLDKWIQITRNQTR